MQRFSIIASFALAFLINSTATAQRGRTRGPADSQATLALYEPGKFKGVPYRLMKPINF